MDNEADKTIKQEQNLDAHKLLDLLGYDYLNPVQLRRIFLLLFRELYSTIDNYSDEEDLKDPPIIYSDKLSKKTLDIDLDFIYDPDEIAQRPGIFIGLGPIQFQKKAIGDIHSHSEDNSKLHYSNFAVTSLHIRHVTTSPDFSYLLANQSVSMVLVLKEMLMNNMPGLAHIELQQISPLQLSDGDPTREFKVDAVFQLHFVFSWASTLEGHRLKEVSQTFKTGPDSRQMTGS